MTALTPTNIIKEINSFRNNPQSIQHLIEVLHKGISRLRGDDPFLDEISAFIQTIDKIPKMPPMNLNSTLSKFANQELQKFINDKYYNKYLFGQELKNILPEELITENVALIADDGADEAQTVVPKILLNKTDSEKKGRKILTTAEYSEVGIDIANYKNENYIVMIFSDKKFGNESEKLFLILLVLFYMYYLFFE